MRNIFLFRTAFVLFLTAMTIFLPMRETSASESGVKVIASIRPVHSLVSGVMLGVGAPKLLVSSGSPHTYSFRPSDAKALAQAQAVFWIGPDLEHFLQGPLKTITQDAEIVSLGSVDGLKILKVRSDFHSHLHPIDMHMWLDPDNAKQFVRQIVQALSKKDPVNADIYKANGAYQLKRLSELSDELEDTLKSAGTKKSIFYHDAFQYFEHRFGLKSAGYVSTGPIRSPGAKHVRRLRNMIISGEVQCVLTEPQFAPAIIQSLVKDTDVQVGVLDPIGAGWTPGPDLYFNMMRKNAEELNSCLN